MPPDAVLAFDTSAAHCAAALLLPGRSPILRHEPMDKGQAERLIPMLTETLAEAGLGWHDLRAIGVGTGPGNFTGVRIAVAAARGLSLSLGIPAIGVTRFAALALDLPRPLAVVEDARRGEIYLQEFAPEPEQARLTEAGSLGVELGDVALVGSAAESVAQVTGGAVLTPRFALAEAIVRIAAASPPGGPRPAPFYLRGADAAPPSDPPPVILDDPSRAD